VVEPPLSATLPAAPVEGLREVAPHHVFVALALFVDVFEDNLVLVGCPVANRVRRWLFQLCLHEIFLIDNFILVILSWSPWVLII